MPRFRLHTLGSLQLDDPAATTSPGQGAPRRRLALLAVLAASGTRGRTRDQLHALFWPDASRRSARHSLEQLLYSIRSSLAEDVFVGVNPLQLNVEVVESDVTEFDALVSAGELEEAASRYTGPFLDGFFLDDAPEFERWVESERSRLDASYRLVLARLGTAASERGDFRSAADWWRRRCTMDPLDGASAAGLMRALDAAGDPVGALRYAEQYEALVARELEVDVGPAISSLVAELRARTGTASNARAVQARPRERTSLPAPVTPTAPPSAHSSPPKLRRTGGRLLALASVLLVTALLGGLGVWRTTSANAARRSNAALSPAVAVLPVTVSGGDSSDAALADGVTQELIVSLARAGLRPVASTSVNALRGTSLDVRRIADTLRVPYVLEGTLQRVGGRARIQLRLIDGRSGSASWAESFERERGDWFGVQQEVAEAVARQLGARPPDNGSRNRAPRITTSLAAYELYLRGQDLALFRTDTGLRVRRRYFEGAIALDSTFAGAWAGLAYTHATMALGGFRSHGPPKELRSLAAAAAERAVALDSTLAEAHAALGAANLIGLHDLRRAERHLRRAITLPGESRARDHLVMVYIALGRPNQALAEAQRSVLENPLSPVAAVELAHALQAAGRCDESLAQFALLANLQPPMARAAGYAAACHVKHARWDAAEAALRDSRGVRGRAILAHVQARAGRHAAARPLLAQAVSEWNRGEGNAFDVALIHAGFGDTAQTIDWLERAWEEGSMRVEVMGPFFDGIRDHPRFATLRTRFTPPEP